MNRAHSERDYIFVNSIFFLINVEGKATAPF